MIKLDDNIAINRSLIASVEIINNEKLVDLTGIGGLQIA